MQTKLLKNLVITGCNRGIGYALVKLICEDVLPYNIIFTARDSLKGQEKFQALKQSYPKTEMVFHELDVTNKESI